MSVSVVQTATGSGSNVTSVSATFSSPVTSSNSIIVGIDVLSGGGSINHFTTSDGVNSWNAGPSQKSNAADVRAQIDYAVNVIGGIITVTVTATHTATMGLRAVEISGLGGSPSATQGTILEGSDTTSHQSSSTSVTIPSGDNFTLCVAQSTDSSTGSSTAGSGYTLVTLTTGSIAQYSTTLSNTTNTGPWTSSFALANCGVMLNLNSANASGSASLQCNSSLASPSSNTSANGIVHHNATTLIPCNSNLHIALTCLLNVNAKLIPNAKVAHFAKVNIAASSAVTSTANVTHFRIQANSNITANAIVHHFAKTNITPTAFITASSPRHALGTALLACNSKITWNSTARLKVNSACGITGTLNHFASSLINITTTPNFFGIVAHFEKNALLKCNSGTDLWAYVTSDINHVGAAFLHTTSNISPHGIVHYSAGSVAFVNSANLLAGNVHYIVSVNIQCNSQIMTVGNTEYIARVAVKANSNLIGKITRIIFSSSGGLLLGNFPTFSQAITAHNPYVWLRLDDSNTTAVNSGSLGSAMNGTYVGSYVQDQGSLILSDPTDDSVYLGGNSVIELPSNTLINSSTPYNARTVEMWFRTSKDVLSRQSLYAEGDTNRGFGIYLYSEVVFVIVWNTTGDSLSTPWGVHYAFSAAVIKPDTIYHVALTFRAGSNFLGGYLNGMLFGSHTGGILSVGQHGPANVGMRINGSMYHDGILLGNGSGFQANVDEFILYGKYLSAGEVAFDYQASLPIGYFTNNFTYTASSGLLLGGSANIGVGVSGSGGLVVGGDALLSAGNVNIVCNSKLFATSVVVPPAFCALKCNSTISAKAICHWSAVSKINCNSFLFSAFSITGSGGLLVGGSGSSQATYDIIKSFTWDINANISLSHDFSWNIQPGTISTIEAALRFYQVETQCRDLGNGCLQSQTVLIVAQNLNEVCDKLNSAGISGPIASIKQYQNPIFLSDFGPNDSVSNNPLIDVTPQFESLSCLNLLSTEIVSTIGGSVSLEFNTFTYSGGQGDIINATGGLLLGDNYGVFTGAGGLLLGGSSSTNVPGFIGIITTSAGGYVVVSEDSVQFPFVDVPNRLTQSTNSIFVPCVQSLLPVVLNVSHDFNNVPAVSNFLRRNNFTLPSVLELLYNNTSWSANVSFTGISTTSSQMERWTFKLELYCQSTANFVSQSNWIFRAVIISRNLSSNLSSLSSLYVLFDSSVITSSQVNLNIAFNVSTRSVTPSAQRIVFTDDGFFADKFFIMSPVINFKIANQITANTVIASTLNLS